MFPFPLSLCLLAIEQDKVQPLSSNGPDLTRYLTVCGILLLSILALAWGFKKLVGNAVRARASSRSLQIVDLLPLGGKQRLAVVRCYDRTFALGVGDKEVGLIAEIDAAATLPKEATTTSRAAFGAVLARLSGRAQARPENQS